jgi:hypothetical protein
MERLDVPIVCNLDVIDGSERATHAQAWDLLRVSCAGVSEEETGVTFRYPATPELLTAAAEWIARERLCCAFFDFELTLPAGSEEFVVRLGGAAGVRDFILENMAPEVSPG